MKRWIACVLAAGWTTGGWAAEPVPAPVSVYPPTPTDLAIVQIATTQAPASPQPAAKPADAAKTPAPATGTPDVTKPLSSVLDGSPTGLPLAAPPVVTADAGCVGCATDCESGWRIPRIPRLSLGLGSSPCMDRLRCYFGWQAGPRVIPALTPTPYQPPLRHYFPATQVAANIGVGCASSESVPFFGPRFLGSKQGTCQSGACRGGRCDGCYESTLAKAVGYFTPRQFGRLQPNCWSYPGAPQVSACASGGCDTAAPAGGSGIYPGLTGGYRFASPVFVPPAQAVYTSGSHAGAVGGNGAIPAGNMAGVAAPGR